MKELEKFTKDIERTQTETEARKREEIEYLLERTEKPKRGHTVWEINMTEGTVVPATFVEAKTIDWSEATSKVATNNKEVQKKPGCAYISALNQSTAMKRLKNGKGSAVIPKGTHDLSNPFKL